MNAKEKMSLGEFLKAIRQCYGKGQAEIAKQLGDSVQFISLIETGKRKIPSKKIDKFALVYGMNAEEKAICVKLNRTRKSISVQLPLKVPSLQGCEVLSSLLLLPRDEQEWVIKACKIHPSRMKE